jgi:hypothetical protein
MAKPKPDTNPPTFFDLSFQGELPGLLRALAARIESGETPVEVFEWRMSHGQLIFGATLDMEGHKK